MISRLILLGALLVAFVVVVLSERPIPGGYGVDGSYYVHIARHIANGDGFVTRVSLHNQGLRRLPSAATVYPLWPIVLGFGGRLLGLELAAVVLPVFFAVLALVAIYALANAVGRCFGSSADILVSIGRLDVTNGHVAAALVAANPSFVESALQPLTDPIALAFVCASLLALDRAVLAGSSVGWAFTSGAAAAGAYLARFQLAPTVIAVAVVLLVAARRGSRLSASFAVAILGISLVMTPWLVHLSATVGDLRLAMLLDFAAHRETPALPPGPMSRGDVGLASRLDDAASSVLAGFLPGSPARQSYLASFGLLALAVPFAVLVVACRRVSESRWPLAGRRALVPLAAIIAGSGALVPVHLYPILGLRHRLPFVLLLIVGVPLLSREVALETNRPEPAARAQFPWRSLFRGALLAGVGFSIVGSLTARRHDRAHLLELLSPPKPAERGAAAWLDAHAGVVAMVVPQRLASMTASTGFHWIGCRTGAGDVLRLLDHVPIDFVVVREGQRRCRWASELPARSEAAITFGSGVSSIAVYPALAVRERLAEATASGDGPERRRRRRRPQERITRPPPEPAAPG